MTAADFPAHNFRNPALLHAALRHSSMAARAREPGEHFERLEFLGDRVVGLIVAHMLMERFPREAEGVLSRHHTALVRAETLAQLARTVRLDTRLQTASNEAAFGGAPNDSMLADALEAVIGAVYLDGGLLAAESVLRPLVLPLLSEPPADLRDPKTRLQEWAQGRGLALPRYDVLSRTGPDHAPTFTVRASVEGGLSATGTGTSKRAAEQQAATQLLETQEHD